MNKNKLIVLLVLLVAVVGLTMGSVSAKSTTKSKYKVVKVKTKFNEKIIKKVGKYSVVTYKKKYSDANVLLIAVGKKKAMKGNKFYTKVYYKTKGKSKVTKWNKGKKKYNYQYYLFNNKIKVNKVGVKFPVS